MIETKKYTSLENLQTFKDNLDVTFATKAEVNDKADEINDAISQKTQVQMTISDASESITELLSTFKIHKLTQEQYDEALANGNLDDNALYLTPDDTFNKAKSYTDTAFVTLKNELLNGAGDAYDTLKELGDLIDENTDAIDALEIIAVGKADSVHAHNDIYNTKSEIDNKVNTINSSIVSTLNDAKLYSDANLNTAQIYTDNAVSHKSQVQIITWEADD